MLNPKLSHSWGLLPPVRASSFVRGHVPYMNTRPGFVGESCIRANSGLLHSWGASLFVRASSFARESALRVFIHVPPSNLVPRQWLPISHALGIKTSGGQFPLVAEPVDKSVLPLALRGVLEWQNGKGGKVLRPPASRRV